jgi:hypothetical protein
VHLITAQLTIQGNRLSMSIQQDIKRIFLTINKIKTGVAGSDQPYFNVGEFYYVSGVFREKSATMSPSVIWMPVTTLEAELGHEYSSQDTALLYAEGFKALIEEINKHA